MRCILQIALILCVLPVAPAYGEAFFMKEAGPGCEKKGIVEGTFGKEIYTDWSMWAPVFLMNSPAMDDMLKKATSLGGNRVVIIRVDGEYLRATTGNGEKYGGTTTKISLVSAIIHGTAYACK